MEKIYQGKSGTTYTIEEVAIASGGEGSIYAIQGNKDLVLKIFKPDRRTHNREEKLLKMVEYQLDEEQLRQINWPQDVVYDDTGFVGYVMPRLWENRNLNVVYSTKDNKLDLRHRMLIAYNLCAAVDTVHSLNQVCGDLNPQNICVNLNLESESALRVTLVDTDSYHITDGDRTHRCEVGLANYLAPEIQRKMANGQDLKSADLPTYTKETDLFALAVHIFALLMNGCHPFACAKQTNTGYENTMEVMDDKEQESVVLPQPIENIRDGFFPFCQEKEGVTYPLYAPNFGSLPVDIQNMFVRAFIDGYHDPTKRPSTEDWLLVLRKCQSPLHYETCEKKHYYLNGNSTSCPYCEANSRMFRMMNNAKFDIPNSESTISENASVGAQQGGGSNNNAQSSSSNTNNKSQNDKAELSIMNKIAIALLVLLAIIVWWNVWEKNIANQSNTNCSTQQYTQTSTDSLGTENVVDMQASADGEKSYFDEDVFVEINDKRVSIPCTYGEFKEIFGPWKNWEGNSSAEYTVDGFEIYVDVNVDSTSETMKEDDGVRNIGIYQSGEGYIETVYGINNNMTIEEVEGLLEHVENVEWDREAEFSYINFFYQISEEQDGSIGIYFDEYGNMYYIYLSYFDWS